MQSLVGAWPLNLQSILAVGCNAYMPWLSAAKRLYLLQRNLPLCVLDSRALDLLPSANKSCHHEDLACSGAS